MIIFERFLGGFSFSVSMACEYRASSRMASTFDGPQHCQWFHLVEQPTLAYGCGPRTKAQSAEVRCPTASETSFLPEKCDWSILRIDCQGVILKRLPGMNCFTHVIQIGAGALHLNQMKSSSHERLNCHKTGIRMMIITMRDRSKNRKPLQKGRSLSIEAIQTVQALKRAAKRSDVSLEQVFDSKFRRLLKFDMIAVLRELLRQNQCLLAIKVFEDVREEDWYRPQLLLYAEMVAVLGSNGLLEKVELLIMELKSETNVNPDLQGFNALLESLMSLNLTGLAVECFYLMKSVSCDPDRLSFKIIIEGLTSNREMELLDVIQQDAQKYYGPFWDFLEKEETDMSS